MEFESVDMKNLDQPAVANQEVSVKPKVMYTRDFLMSLSQLDICKKVPNGFDKSILNVFHDAFHCSQERTRTSGSFVTRNFKQTEYSASPPSGQDVSSYPRGSNGKWENRSRDGGSQTNLDSDSGRQIVNHSRRPWQSSEHDGLLGSGSLPRLTGYTSGTSTPKFRSNDQFNLNRSSAPYQPPRPYKAVPHSRITTFDLHNDETFGSPETTSKDQAEEERKRRAEFELMRNERHKSGQEKHLLSSVDSSDGLIFDTIDNKRNLVGGKKTYCENNELVKSSAILTPRNDSIKLPTSMHTSVARPIRPPGFVPPGFGNTNSVSKSTIKYDTKVQTFGIDEQLVYCTVKSSKENNTDDKTLKQLDDPPHLDQCDHSKIVELSANEECLDAKIGVLEFNATAPNQDFATLFLEDGFGSSLTKNGSGLSKLIEHPDGYLHGNCKGTMGSSKFAHWFAEGDGKRLEDCQSSEKTAKLFSLTSGGPPRELISNDTKAAKTNDTVLTCEDLEHSILSELSRHNVPSETLQGVSVSRDANVVQPIAGTDALASQNLLSVLQKGAAPKDMSNINQHQLEQSSVSISTDNLKQRTVDKTSNMGKNPNLEALFDSAFLKELQVIDAPVSTKNSLTNDSSRFQLPEKENLFTGSVPLNVSKSLHGHGDNTGRLGALSAMFSDGRSGQDNPAFPRNLYEKTVHTSVYRNIHPLSSRPQFPPSHMNQGRPMFNQTESQRPSPQMRFPNNMSHHDQPLPHPVSQTRQMFHQPRPMRFDFSSQQPMMQQEHLQSNTPPLHLLRQYSGNLPQSPHSNNQVHGFRQELDPIQEFRGGHQQPGFGGLGMSSPVSAVSGIGLSNHRLDMVQQLMEMELRSKEKPKYPCSVGYRFKQPSPGYGSTTHGDGTAIKRKTKVSVPTSHGGTS